MAQGQVVFRSTFRTNLGPLGILVATLCLAISAGFLLPLGLATARAETAGEMLPFVVQSPVGLLLGIALVGVAYLGAYLWTDRLVFTEWALQHHALPLPIGIKSIPYDQVLCIRQSMRGVLVIETEGKEVMLIRAGGYEGGWPALARVMRARIGEDRIQPEVWGSVWEWTWADRWSVGLTGLALGFFVLAIGWSYLQNQGRGGLMWNVGAKAGLRTEILDFTLGPLGSLWRLERKGWPFDQGEGYQVVRSGEGEETVWELPEIPDLLPTDRNAYTYPHQVLVDGENNPWLTFRFFDRILYRHGDGWQWLQIPRSVSQGYVQFLIPSEGAFWGNQEGQLVVVEPDELAVWRVPGFSDAVGSEIELFPAPKGGVALAFFSSGRRLIGELSLDPGGLEWVEISAIPAGVAIERGNTLATKSYWGTPYIIHWSESDCAHGEASAQIGSYPSEERGWIWDELTLPHDCQDPFRVEGIVVDAHERVWVASSRRVWVDAQPGVETAGIQYSEQNSGYYHGTLRQDRYGRIWSLDERGQFLIWMDGRVEYLPQPLPASVAWLLGSAWIPLIFQYLGIITLLGVIVVVWRANRFGGQG